MAAKRGKMAISELCTVLTLQGAFRLNSANYKKKSIFRFLPDLHENLVGIQNFTSKCLKIVATNCEFTIAELQIKPKSKSNQTKNLEGSIIAWFLSFFLSFLFVTLRTVLMLLLPVKMLK